MIDADHEHPTSTVRLGTRAQLRPQKAVKHALQLTEILPICVRQLFHDIVRECDRQRPDAPYTAVEFRYLPVRSEHTRPRVPGSHILSGYFIQHRLGKRDKVEHHGSP